MKICECGCGKEIKEYRRFVHGHNKGHTTPHSAATKEKMRIARETWEKSEEYKVFLKKMSKVGKESKTQFVVGHVSFTDGSNLKGLQAGENHWKWNGGKNFAAGYILVWSPNHPHKSKRGYVQEHRLIMEKKLGRYLDPEEVVHHINEIKSDNRIENLQLMTRSEHALHHIRKRYAQS